MPVIQHIYIVHVFNKILCVLKITFMLCGLHDWNQIIGILQIQSTIQGPPSVKCSLKCPV